MTTKDIRGKNIVFFDGNCMLCNSFIAYLVKKKNSRLFFCDINSATANTLLAPFQLQNSPQNTIYFLQDNKLFNKSTAVFKILHQLSPTFKFISNIGLLFPLFIRDGVYSWVAKNRYRLFKKGACYLPTPEEREKFI
jgi:predicted DCC family thiol-disulfide oxidoreductase YuxK